jgi:amino acid transporter
LFRRLLYLIIGKKLPNTSQDDEKYSLFWGMPILSSDAICSVSYAIEAMMWILFPVIGAAAYLWTPRVAVVIVVLLIILTFSYRQTVSAYPNGGGSYIVASDNLGPMAGLVAGTSLATDYVLDVAVSVCSAVAAIYSALPQFSWIYNYRVLLCLAILLIMMIGNLRGLKESSRMFSIPTYLFVIAIVAMCVDGIIKFYTGHFTGHVLVQPPAVMPFTALTQAAFVYLILKAFASGCAALTGIEAIANGVPNFKEPTVKNAQFAYILLGLFTGVTFAGVAYLAKIYGTVPDPQVTILAQIAYDVFGWSWGFYAVQITTMLILAMAADTAYADFPMLFSILARDGFAPRPLALRGHRLYYENGIVLLTILAGILIVAFQGNTNMLIPLFCVGVFAAFTLSQGGMVVHWLKLKTEGWYWKVIVNGTGCVMTGVAVIVEGVTKFTAGAWVIILVIPMLILVMLQVHKHYISVAQDLDVPDEDLGRFSADPCSSDHVIIPVDNLNAVVLYALRYAKSLSNNVEAFHVETQVGEADKLRRKWEALHTDIPLIVKYSEYRDVVQPLIEYIESAECAFKPGGSDMITVLLPQFIVNKWWQVILHSQTSLSIGSALLKERSRNIVVSVLPFALKKTTMH